MPEPKVETWDLKDGLLTNGRVVIQLHSIVCFEKIDGPGLAISLTGRHLELQFIDNDISGRNGLYNLIETAFRDGTRLRAEEADQRDAQTKVQLLFQKELLDSVRL